MVGSSPGPLRRLLAPAAALLRTRQPPLSPALPGPPLMTRSEILSRYRRLRQISKQQHEAVLDIIAADVLRDWARQLGLTVGKTVVLENDNELTLPEDLAIYLPRLGSHTRSSATPGSHTSRPVPPLDAPGAFLALAHRAAAPDHGSDPARSAARRGDLAGDEAMERNAPPGVAMAARLLQPESFAMTARLIMPVLPDLMPRPDLMDEVLTRAPALKRLQGDGLAQDPRFAIGIYRAAVATGAMERVRFKRKRAGFMWTDA
jgi:hypothetical protein